jgi:cytochrome c553
MLTSPLISRARATAVTFSIAVVAACSTAGTSTGDPFQDHMYAHFSSVGAIQTAVIFGNLEEARDRARDLAEHDEVAGMPEGSDAFRQAMRGTARRLAESTTTEDVSLLTAELAATCGRCHQATDGGPVFNVEVMDPGDPVGTMVRHVQGADRMWDGLIGPSDESWQVGAELLARGSVDQELIGGVPGGESLVVDVFRLGREAQDARSQDDRARTYGRILATCSRCHTPS